MARIETRCPYCHKKVEVTSEVRDDGFKVVFKTYSCGHTVTEDIVALPPLSEGMKLVCKKCLVVVDPNNYADSFSQHEECEWENTPALIEIPESRLLMFSRLKPFQMEGVEFLEESNYSAALCDEQGLGKTVQILQAIAHHKAELTPTLYVVKASLRMNWLNEQLVNGWLCDRSDPLDIPFVLMEGRSAMLPGFRHYILPYTLLEKFKSQIIKFGFKCLVVDESQNFANMATQRTRALLEIAAHIPHKLTASGTPILNRATEYFPTLHMVKPDHWNNYKRFVNNWIEEEQVWNPESCKYSKKLKGIKEWRRTEFFQRTSSYMLRRRKRDVLKDLPPFRRTFTIVDISETGIRDAYNDKVKELDKYLHSEEYFRAGGFERSRGILAYLMKMRHLCGMAKVVICIEQAADFLESTDTEQKLLIGCHHDDVMDELGRALAAYNPVMFPSGMDPFLRQRRTDEFRTPARRLGIAKILAQGEGQNWQFCQNIIMLERQWNPGKEEQFEARIDRYGQQFPTTADYIVAKNTVDEDFSGLVEDKRQFIGKSTDYNFDFESNIELLTMLAERASKRMI